MAVPIIKIFVLLLSIESIKMTMILKGVCIWTLRKYISIKKIFFVVLGLGFLGWGLCFCDLGF